MGPNLRAARYGREGARDVFLPSLGRKVDTKALPESVDVSSTSSSSLTALERVVASVWEAIRALSKCSNKSKRGFAEGPDQCFFIFGQGSAEAVGSRAERPLPRTGRALHVGAAGFL